MWSLFFMKKHLFKTDGDQYRKSQPITMESCRTQSPYRQVQNLHT